MCSDARGLMLIGEFRVETCRIVVLLWKENYEKDSRSYKYEYLNNSIIRGGLCKDGSGKTRKCHFHIHGIGYS